MATQAVFNIWRGEYVCICVEFFIIWLKETNKKYLLLTYKRIKSIDLLDE